MCTSFSTFKKTLHFTQCCLQVRPAVSPDKNTQKNPRKKVQHSLELYPNELMEAELGHRKQTRAEVGQGNPKCGLELQLCRFLGQGGGSEGCWCQHQQTPCPALPSTSSIRNCTHRCSLLPLHFPLQLHHLHSSTFPLKNHTCFYTRQPQNPLTSMTPLNLKPRNKTPDTLKAALPVVRVHFCYIWLQK